MKKTHNKIEAEALNNQLTEEIKEIEVENKEQFQGYSPKEQKIEKTKKGKKKKTPKQIFLRILVVIGILLVTLIAGFFILRAIGKSSLFRKNVNMEKTIEGASVKDNGNLVVYKGHKYRYNENITSILFMGVDRESINSDEEFLKENGAGQSDTLFLAVLDTASGKTSLINISRDIMTDVKMYDSKGKYKGTTPRQICLAYAYGDGKQRSCTNTVEAVSKLLYGIPIDSYMSMNLSTISVLNDAIGGVTVQVQGDLTSIDPALKEGANVTLLGDQAEAYVRTREEEPVDANNARMQRQQQYIASYIQKAVQEVRGDIMLPVDLFNLVSENAVTNLSATKLVYLATAATRTSFSSNDILNIEGTVKTGDTQYAEYYPDETKLFETILKVFYTQVS